MTYREIFKEFLEEQGIYSRYMELAEEYQDTAKSLEDMFNQRPPVYWISEAFVFSQTKEGLEYWDDIQFKWFKVVDKYIR